MSLAEQLLFFLPWCWLVNMSLNALGYATNRVPALARIDVPVDFGRTFPNGMRILGDARTWNGLGLSFILGSLGSFFFPDHGLFRLALLVWVGDALGSFVKRRLGIPRGRYTPFIDHGDYVIVAGAYAYAAGYLSLLGYAGGYVFTILVTPLVTYGAYALGLRNRPL